MENKLSDILEHYKKEKGSMLSGFEMWSISKWFIPHLMPITETEKQINIQALKSIVYVPLRDIVNYYKPPTVNDKTYQFHTQTLIKIMDNTKLEFSSKDYHTIEASYLNGFIDKTILRLALDNKEITVAEYCKIIDKKEYNGK